MVRPETPAPMMRMFLEVMLMVVARGREDGYRGDFHCLILRRNRKATNDSTC